MTQPPGLGAGATAPQARAEPRASLVWALALLPVLGAYTSALDVGFMWDDHTLIEQNEELHALRAPWAYLGRSFWQHPFAHGLEQAYYRPTVVFSLAVDWALGGGLALWFHFTNVALHLGVCSLVFVHALRRSASSLTAGAVALLFGVMPRLTESVTWVVGRTDVLATLFVLLALLLADRARGAWLAGAALWLGLLSKEVALVGALLLVAQAAVSVARGETPWRRQVSLTVSVAVAVAAWWVLRRLAQVPQRLALQDLETFLAGLGHYALMLLTPWRPAAQIGLASQPEGWAAALGGVALAAALVVGWRWLRSPAPWRAAWLGAALAGVALVSLAVLPVYTIASDRFLYFPLACLAVVAAQRPWGRKPVALAVVAALALGLAVVTARRNALWAAPLRFWQQTHAEAARENYGAAVGLADALFDVHRLEESRELLVRVTQGRPEEQRYRLSLAVVESKLGHDAEALALLGAILAADPSWRRAAYDLVLFRARGLDFPGARDALAQARARFGDDAILREFDALLAAQEPRVSGSSTLEQARAFHALGAVRKAELRYVALLAEPSARDEAARWLVLFGAEAHAQTALAALPGDAAAAVTWAERFPPEG